MAIITALFFGDHYIPKCNQNGYKNEMFAKSVFLLPFYVIYFLYTIISLKGQMNKLVAFYLTFFWCILGHVKEDLANIVHHYWIFSVLKIVSL